MNTGGSLGVILAGALLQNIAGMLTFTEHLLYGGRWSMCLCFLTYSLQEAREVGVFADEGTEGQRILVP